MEWERMCSRMRIDFAVEWEQNVQQNGSRMGIEWEQNGNTMCCRMGIECAVEWEQNGNTMCSRMGAEWEQNVQQNGNRMCCRMGAEWEYKCSRMSNFQVVWHQLILGTLPQCQPSGVIITSLIFGPSFWLPLATLGYPLCTVQQLSQLMCNQSLLFTQILCRIHILSTVDCARQFSLTGNFEHCTNFEHSITACVTTLSCYYQQQFLLVKLLCKVGTERLLMWLDQSQPEWSWQSQLAVFWLPSLIEREKGDSDSWIVIAWPHSLAFYHLQSFIHI